MAAVTHTTMGSLFFFNGYFMGVRIRVRLLCIVAKDGSKPSVSWLNFEPIVSKFPSNSSYKVAAVTHTAIRSLFCFNVYLCESE